MSQDFIEEIVFQEDFPPFKKWQKISLWGTQDFQILANFYLQNVEKISRNEKYLYNDRIKLNIITGKNWVWKSRFFHSIMNIKSQESISWNNLYDEIISNLENKTIFLDDFFYLSDQFDYSINKEVFKKWKNIFFINLVKFLWTNKTINKLYEKFLNIDISKINLKIRFTQNIDFKNSRDQKTHLKYTLNNIDFFSKENIPLDIRIYLLINYYLKNIQNNAIKNSKINSYTTNLSEIELKCKDKFIEIFESISNESKYKYMQLYYVYVIIKIQNTFIMFFSNENTYLEEKDILELNSIKLLLIDIINNCNSEKDFNDKIKLQINSIIDEIKKIEEIFKVGWKPDNKKLSELTLNINIYDYLTSQIFKTFVQKANNILISKIYIDQNWEINNYFKNLDTLAIKKYDDLIDVDIKFFNNNSEYSFNNLSAWEKTLLTRFTNIYMRILFESDNEWKNFIILIDEPDLHLHLEWQKQYIQRLIDIFSTLWDYIKIQFIIATHSPFIISDIPESCIVRLENWVQKINTDTEKQTFWANYIDIINDEFYFDEKHLMWSFSEIIIWHLADKEREAIFHNEENRNEDLKKYIWDDFLRDNLAYFKRKK